MRILALLNRDGGTLKTTDLDWLSALIRDEFRVHGHAVTVEICPGSEIVEAIETAAHQDDVEVLLVGGGDGTVSAAAAALFQRDKALAILPAGTMNLFARTLQIPLNLETAVKALAGGTVTAVDAATVNGQPFIHQFAAGLHARMVRYREKITYGSRIGKIWATTRAVALALKRLPKVELVVKVDGRTERLKCSAIAISNNLYGPGHLPFADNPKGGVLGIYICTERNIRRVAKLTLDILMGNWRRNPHLVVKTATRLELAYSGKTNAKRAVRDGELDSLDELSTVELHPLALNVLVPAEATFLDQIIEAQTAAMPGRP
ncbi:diacylglycerol kinase family lipid kinase [Jiella sp. MQZ9-1]|uniref:Diacylglycerol kinase family lipid kinase n=1 Tax=Jiella flava TaxID=2816857 RepID=A0A939FXV3_9HYPH|nr:diacylglycerol kinase family protein [Jiella flava]MBO0663998.1 diacylglycerol kinase family lipid kinase [Jiella flava]MCD2472569.1 diacylglycerol kinase family lipid kinase [Jiella flava]